MPDDGVVLESGTTVTVSDSTSAQCFFEKLTMQESCVFKVGTNAYISNYKHDEHGLDAVTDFVPEGYSIGVYQAPLGIHQYVTIADKAGNIATNYELRYRFAIHSLPLNSIRIHMSMMAMKKNLP